MESNQRKKIAELMITYQACQAHGVKDIDKQLKLFTEDCTIARFAASAALDEIGIFTYNGIEEIRQYFEKYNALAESPENVKIENFDTMIDEKNMRCSFNMLMYITGSSIKPKEFFNAMQFFINKDFKIYKAYNWQGDADNGALYDLLERRQ